MRKFKTKLLLLHCFLGLIVALLGTTISSWSASNEAYFSIADMGNSSTGVELSRMILEQPKMAPVPFLGYVLNGEFTWYANWPPAGFQILAWWFKMTSDTSLSNARFFHSLIYGLNALLFFLLMLKCGLKSYVAFLSSLFFILLPLHLLYGRMVFPDVWLLSFWLLAFLVLNKELNKTYWLFLLLVCLGAFRFMWFVIFIAPVPVLMKWVKKRDFSVKHLLLGLLIIVLGIWIVQWVLISKSGFGGSYLVSSLKRWTIFELPNYIKTNQSNIFKRVGALVFEFLPLLVLILFSSISVTRVRLSQWLKSRSEISFVIVSTWVTLIIYVLSVPVWFLNHTHATGMFALFIATLAGAFMRKLNEISRLKLNYLVSVCITITLLFYVFVSSISSRSVRDYRYRLDTISNLISSTSLDTKLCLFFDLREDDSVWFHAIEFAVKEKRNSYIFNKEKPDQTDFITFFRKGMSKLKEIGYSDFNTEKVIYITNKRSPIYPSSVTTMVDLKGDLHAYVITIED